MSGLVIAMSVLGAVGIVVGGAFYLSNKESNKNPYDLSDQFGNTRTGLYNQWNPTPQVQNEYSYSAGSKRKRNKKNNTRRYKKIKNKK